MGWASAEVKQKIETVRLWCRIRNMPESRMIYKIHNWSLSVGRSWENKMLKFIDSLNIRDCMMAPKPSKYICLKLAKEKLIEIDSHKWKEKLMHDGNNENGNKLRTYRTYKDSLDAEPYVKLNMRRDQRRILAKFRGCNLPLSIETGRYTKPKTPLNERLCRYCDKSVIENEIHFLIDCELYSDIRYELFQNAISQNNSFQTMSSGEKLIFLMKSDNLQIKLSSVLLLMNRRRRNANPI